MVRRISSTIIIILALLFTLLSSTAIYSQDNGGYYIVDMLGRTVYIRQFPSKIVSLAPSITETIFALGLEDYLVGVDDNSYNDTFYNISVYLRSHGVESVGGYWWSTINLEKILALEPELVIADKGAHLSLLSFFEENNITVVYVNGGSASSIEDLYSDIDLISRIFNKTSEAVELVSFIEEKISSIKRELLTYHGLRVLVIVGVWNGVWVAGKATYIDDLLSRLGFINVATVTGWKPVNIETISSWNPDVILVTTGMGLTNATLSEIGVYDLGVPVILLNSTETDLLCRPGPLVGYAAEAIAYRVIETVEPVMELPLSVTTSTTTIVKTHTETRTMVETSTVKEQYNETIASTSGLSGFLQVAITAIISCLIGVIAGYLVSRRIR